MGNGLGASHRGVAPEDRRAKVFTVTVAGLERFDGEAPYTWVLEAPDMASAIRKAVAYHAVSVEERVCDLEIVLRHTFEGLPPANCGYYWNDLRTEVLD